MAQDEAAPTVVRIAKKPPPKPARTRPSKQLPTDRIGFAKQLDLLRAYAAASGPTNRAVSLNDVAGIANMAASTISLASPFFTDVGLIQRTDAGFLPSAEVINFSRAYEWNPDTASHKLAPLFSQGWFATALIPKVTFSSISDAEAIERLAEAATAGPDYEGQLSTIIDYLAAAGLVLREAGQVRKAGNPATTERPSVPSATSGATDKDPPKPTITTSFSQQPLEGAVQFHVSVKVSMGEFATWQADRIQAFFQGIAEVLKAKGAVEQEAGKD